MSGRPNFTRIFANRALLGVVAVFLLGCSGNYKISPDVPAMTERDALAFIARMTATPEGRPWVCWAGDGLHGGSISGLSLSGATLSFNVRFVSSSIPVTSVNTVTGETTIETNRVVRDQSREIDLRNLNGIRIYKGKSSACGPIASGRWLTMTGESRLTLVAAPPAPLFEQTIAALKVLNPDRKIKTGLGF